MSVVVFFLASFGALAGAIGVLWTKNPFYSVLALVGHLVSLAALFLLLRAEFVAAAQVVVYAGAVMVLYVFVVAYIGGAEPEIGRGPSYRGLAIVFVGLVLVELCVAILGSGLEALDTEGAGYNPGSAEPFGSPQWVGRFLLTKFLLPFEVASLLLLVAAVGAVVLARRRRGIGIEDGFGDAVSAIEFFLPRGTGSMAEGVSGIPEGAQAKEPAGPALPQGGGW